MPQSEFVSAVRAVNWHDLESTYESGEVVRDIVLSLASRDEAEAERAWREISETVLQHQGTVYPATAAAAPFLCQIVLDETALYRAALAAELAFLSTGYDEPYAPAGTALDEVGQSLSWVIRDDKLTSFVPNPSPFPRPAEEPYIKSPVPEAIQAAARLRSGADEQTRDSFPVFSFLVTLMESGGRLIDWPI